MFRIRLKQLRENAGYTQYSFAKQFGISQAAIAHWESGKREPNFETTQRLADFFGVSVDYLLGRVDELNTDDFGTGRTNLSALKNPLDKQLEGLDFALFGETKDMTDKQKEDVIKFARFIKQQEEGRKS